MVQIIVSTSSDTSVQGSGSTSYVISTNTGTMTFNCPNGNMTLNYKDGSVKDGDVIHNNHNNQELH